MPEPVPTAAPTDATPPAAVRVLSYEKPLVYRYRSDLPPPGVVAKVFWKGCFVAGKLVGLVYRSRPAPRLYRRGP